MATVTPIRSLSKTIGSPSGSNYVVLDDGVGMGKATLENAVSAVADSLISSAITGLSLGTASQAAVDDFATSAQGAKADSAVQPARNIAVGAGLSGGGNLSADRTISLSVGAQTSLALADSAIQQADMEAYAAPIAKAVPVGGTTGQVLAKTSNSDNAVAWGDAGAGDMIKSAYDPDSVNANAFDRANHVGLLISDIDSKTIPAVVIALDTDGFAAANDGGAIRLARVGSEPSHPGKKQSSDGTWWEYTDREINEAAFGVFSGSGIDGVVNASRINDATAYLAAVGGGEITIRKGTYNVGDASTYNTVIQARSNVTIRHEPGVVYVHRALGRQSPDSTDVDSAWLARQACFLQIDGKEFGAISNFHFLGKPVIDGENTTPIRRGIEIYGEVHNITVEAHCKNLRDMAMIVGDDDNLRFTNGSKLRFSIDYSGTHPAAVTQLIDIFPKGSLSGQIRPIKDVVFYDCDMDGTGGTATGSTNDVVNCLKVSNVDGLHFAGRCRFRGGTISCLDLINGTRNVSGVVDVGQSPIGVIVSASSQVTCWGKTPTENVVLDIFNSADNVDATINDAIRVYGNVPGVDCRVFANNGGIAFYENEDESFDVSGMTGAFAWGDTVTSNLGATATLRSWNATSGFIGLDRNGMSGTFSQGDTFTTSSGGSGTLGAAHEMDGCPAPRFTGRTAFASVRMEATPVARTPIRGAKIDLLVDAQGHATAASGNNGSANWTMCDSDIRLQVVNGPPTYPFVNYGVNNRITVSSSGEGTFNSASSLLRDYGKGTRFDGTMLTAGLHGRLWTLESGCSDFECVAACAPATRQVQSASTSGQPIARGTKVLRADFDLSAAAKVVPLYVSSRGLIVTGVEIVYPGGSTADAGVEISIGIVASPAAYYKTTSLTSRSAGYVQATGRTGSSTGLTDLLAPSGLSAAGLLVARCAGGKTGADLVTVFVHVIECRTP